MDSPQHTIPNYYLSQDGEPLFEQLDVRFIAALWLVRKSFGYPKNQNSTISFSGGLHNDQEIIVINIYNISDFRPPYDPQGHMN